MLFHRYPILFCRSEQEIFIPHFSIASQLIIALVLCFRTKNTTNEVPIQLSKYPVLNNLERQTSVPKVYVILGLAGIYTFLVFFNIAGQLLVNLAGFILPTYYSLNALFTAGKSDDTQVSTLPA